MIIFYLISIVTAIIIAFWLFFWWSATKFSSRPTIVNLTTYPKVTVIVAFKNEEKSIHRTITEILAQEYPDFVLIAINDHSTDSSYEIASQIKDDRLLLLQNETKSGKKYALTLAIDQAETSYLLFTDADCIPVSKHWIHSMISHMLSKDGIEIVLGVAPLCINHGFLNTFARYENVMTAIQYLSYAMHGMPYMGVGRNLMYKKEYFRKIGGFSSHMHTSSGDDDLTVSALSNGKNTVVNVDKISFVYSEAAPTVKTFIRQKSRHITTSVNYKWVHKVLLGLFGLVHLFWLPLMLAAMTIDRIDLSLTISILALKWGLQLLLQRNFYNILDTSKLTFWFPLLDIFYSIYLLILLLYSPLRNKNWK